MIERIKEKNVWDTIASSERPIVLYGMGNGADMVLNVLEGMGVKPAEVFASDAFVRGQTFRGYKVRRYSEVCGSYDDFLIVMCFAVRDRPTLDRVREMSLEHELVAPNVPIVDDGLFTREYVSRHDAEFDLAYDMLADDHSKKSYLDVLNFKISGRTEYLFGCEKEKSEVYSDILRLGRDEIFMDLGAYDGDTVREFIEAAGGEYSAIYAVEADEKNFGRLCEKTADVENIRLFNLAAWDEKTTLSFAKKKGRNSRLSDSGNVEIPADSVDNILAGERITLLKMDIEGSEERALLGAADTIRRYKPKLYVCGYHRNSDMFRIPAVIRSFDEDYEIYFCHHPYIPAWESNFYSILKK